MIQILDVCSSREWTPEDVRVVAQRETSPRLTIEQLAVDKANPLRGTAMGSGSGRLSKSFRALRFAAGLGALVAVAHANGQCNYDVTIIQGPSCPPLGPRPTFGTSVNAAGDIAGYHCLCSCEWHQAFEWVPRIGLTAIVMPPGVSSSEAWDKNDNGWLVGELTDDINLGTFAFVYEGAQVTNLGALPGGTFSQAHGINNAGQVVGNWCNNVTGPCPLAFVWQNGQMIDISSDFGKSTNLANAINDNGQVTGWMGSNILVDGNAFIWQNGTVTVLPPLPGGYMSEGLGINSAGDICGEGKLGSPTAVHAFVYTGAKMTDLGTLPGFIWSAAMDINDSKAVVGRSWNSGGNPSISRAFLWQDGVMTDLDALIPPSLGITIQEAWGINNSGQIAGTAKPAGGGNSFAVLLTPNALLGDLNGDCTVTIVDFLSLLLAWGPCPPAKGCPADLDGDGSVGIIDFLTLLGNWG